MSTLPATESNRIEFKREVPSSLERMVVGFLNYREGGVLYIGVNDDGSVYGVPDADAAQLAIKNRLRDNIAPSCMGLFDVVLMDVDGKAVLRIDIASGCEKPYYIKNAGMSPKGCFLRVGSSVEAMPEDMIETLFARRARNSLRNMESPRDDLTFTQLKIHYEGRGLELNGQFLKTLEFLTSTGSYNYAAYLMADSNGNSVKFAKYAGRDRVDLIENEEFGRCSLLKSFFQLETRLRGENKTFAKITFERRLERKLVEETPLREAVLNALLHNDYTYGATPKVEMFSDRIEVTSAGGLPPGVSREDFLSGYSNPRNKELMRIFHDLGIVESLGSGIPRILSKYPPENIQITDSYIRVVFPFAEGYQGDSSSNGGESKGESKGENNEGKNPVVRLPENSAERNVRILLQLLSDHPRLTIPTIASFLDISESGVQKILRRLRSENRIRRIGSTKAGRWEVLPPSSDSET